MADAAQRRGVAAKTMPRAGDPDASGAAVRTGAGRVVGSLLRRNVHRLEKGLVMRPRCEVFAVGYITETTKCYAEAVRKRLTDGSSSPDRELGWAHDVLREYFRVTGRHPVINRARDRFEQLEAQTRSDAGPRAPYRRDLSVPSPVSYEDLEALSRRRRSVRWYLPKPVPPELLDRAIAIAAQEPSACNRQPFEFRIYDDPDLVRRVAELPMGTPGFRHDIPAIVVVVGRLRAFFSDRDRHVPCIESGLASMSQAFGPFRQPDVRRAFAETMEAADLVFARDEQSYAHVVDVTGDRPELRIAPDFTMGLSVGPLPSLNGEPAPEVCIIPNDRMMDKAPPDVRESYLSFLDVCVEYARDHGLAVAVLVHDDEPDTEIASALQARSGRDLRVVSRQRLDGVRDR